MNRDYLMFRRTAIFKRNKTWVGIVKLKENWKHRLYIYNAVEFTGYANSNSNNTKNMDKIRLYLLNSSFTHYCWRHRNRKGIGSERNTCKGLLFWPKNSQNLYICWQFLYSLLSWYALILWKLWVSKDFLQINW